MDTSLHQTVGLGLRLTHYDYIIENNPKVAWFEAIIESHLETGVTMEKFEKIAKNYPIVLHGVGMSLGSCDELNLKYLEKLKTLIENFNVKWVSDHLCWCTSGKHYFPDLYPLPYNEESINQIVNKIQKVQEFLKQPILVENLSSYIEFENSEMTEWEFVKEVAERSGCYLLLDINNIYVSSYNHNFNALDYLNHIPKDKVREYHLAGFSDKKTHYFDTHDNFVHPDVWKFYEYAVKHIGRYPTLIEWDNNIPDFKILQQEAKKAEIILQEKELCS